MCGVNTIFFMMGCAMRGASLPDGFDLHRRLLFRRIFRLSLKKIGAKAAERLIRTFLFVQKDFQVCGSCEQAFSVVFHPVCIAEIDERRRADAVEALVKQLDSHGMRKLGERQDITLDVSRAILEDAC